MVPHLGERHGEQRQGVGLVGQVGQHLVDQPGLQAHVLAPRRPPDGVAHPVVVERPQQVGGAGQRGAERGVLVQRGELVGPDGGDHEHAVGRGVAQRGQTVEQPVPLGLVLGARGDLLELVDGEHEPVARRRCARGAPRHQRVGERRAAVARVEAEGAQRGVTRAVPGAHHEHVVTRSGGQRGHDAGQQHR